MALNIKNSEVERLAAEIATICNETKTEAIRRALLERKHRLAFRVDQRSRPEQLKRFLEREIWPKIPPKKLTQLEQDEILGYGPEGV